MYVLVEIYYHYVGKSILLGIYHDCMSLGIITLVLLE